MNTTPLAQLPNTTPLDPTMRKRTLWEMYDTALGTASLAKNNGTWPSYIVASDPVVLNVARKVELDLATIQIPDVRHVHHAYTVRSRNAMGMLRDAKRLLQRVQRVFVGRRVEGYASGLGFDK
jgi:hypothetical protein